MLENTSLTSPSISTHPSYLKFYSKSIITIKDPAELIELIQEFFGDCFNRNRLPTVVGLARALGLSRNDLLTEQYDEKFRPIILDAKQRIEEASEEYLYYGKNPQAVQFLLKNNFKYTDKVELEHTQKTLTDFLSE